MSVSNLTSQGLLNALNNFNGTEKEVLANLFIKKIKNNKNFRPLIFYIGYCLAKGLNIIPIDKLPKKEKDLIRDITASIEIENIATYYINHYIDQKCDIKDLTDEKNRVLAGVLCRNIQQEIIEKLTIDTKIKIEIMKILRKIDQDISRAQIFEVNRGIFKEFAYFKNEDAFLKEYLERCRKISGQFYGRSAEIGYITGAKSVAKSAKKKQLVEFYTEMATIGQFSNDIGDYALANMHSGTIEKNYYKDFGSDLKNQRLTYPNYLLLKRVNDINDFMLIYSIISEGFSDKTALEFIKLMNKLHVFKDSLLLLDRKSVV